MFAETVGTEAGDAFVKRLTRKGTDLATRNNVQNVERMSMTKDEWSSSGLENAEAAENEAFDDLSLAESLLKKAIYCFQHAENEELVRKAQAHQTSIQLKSKMPEIPAADILVREDGRATNIFQGLEAEASEVVETLLKENLLDEAKNLISKISPYTSPFVQKRLERNFISKL